MKDCLQEQKEVESQLQVAEILLSEKTMDEYKRSLNEYEKGFEDTI